MLDIMIVGDVKNPQDLLATLNTILKDQVGRVTISVVGVSQELVAKELEMMNKLFKNKDQLHKRREREPELLLNYQALVQLMTYFDNHDVLMVEKSEENETLPMLLNAAIKAGSEDYILIMDASTLMPHRWFEAIYVGLRQHVAPVGMTGRLVHLSLNKIISAGVSDTLKLFPEYRGFLEGNNLANYSGRLRIGMLPKEFMIFDRSAYKQVGRFNEKFNVAFWDFEFSSRLIKAGIMNYEPGVRAFASNNSVTRVWCALEGKEAGRASDRYMEAYKKDFERWLQINSPKTTKVAAGK